MLKPGLIGLARIVVDRIDGFRVPEASIVLRDDQRLLFSVSESDVAQAYTVTDWIQQEGDFILRELPSEHRKVVVRGQHRLVDGRPVVLVEPNSTTTPAVDVSLRAVSSQP